jgi:hypothetical protein
MLVTIVKAKVKVLTDDQSPSLGVRHLGAIKQFLLFSDTSGLLVLGVLSDERAGV